MRFLITSLILLIFSVPVFADTVIYQGVDQKGNAVFSDHPIAKVKPEKTITIKDESPEQIQQGERSRLRSQR